MLNRSADQVDHPSYPDRKYDKNSDHQGIEGREIRQYQIHLNELNK